MRGGHSPIIYGPGGVAKNIASGSFVDPKQLRVVAVINGSSSNLSIADETYERLDFNSVELDTLSSVTTGASWTLSVPAAGILLINVNITWTTFSNMSENRIAVYKNNSIYKDIDNQPSGSGVGGSIIVPVAASDAIDIRLYQNDTTSAARTIYTGANHANRFEAIFFGS